MSIKALERHLLPLLPFINMDGVTEICINQPGKLFVEKKGCFTSFNVKELSYPFLESMAALIAEFNQKDFPTPLLSGSLPSGERVQFVMNPGCEKQQFVCSIRRHQKRNLSLDDFKDQGAFTNISSNEPKFKDDKELQCLYHNNDVLSFLKLAIQQKKNILISGGTGVGKTTFLNACIQLIPENERIITVEDTREVTVHQPNVVHLLFNEEDSRLTALKIFKTCLRLRPDRIFLSELRGDEVWPYLRAANSGHSGTLSTVHADSPEGAITQLIFMMQQAGSTSKEAEIRRYIKSIIHIVIQLKRSSCKNKFMTVSDIYFDQVHSNKSLEVL
jgi:type IV secretion system protein VirB11